MARTSDDDAYEMPHEPGGAPLVPCRPSLTRVAGDGAHVAAGMGQSSDQDDLYLAPGAEQNKLHLGNADADQEDLYLVPGAEQSKLLSAGADASQGDHHVMPGAAQKNKKAGAPPAGTKASNDATADAV